MICSVSHYIFFLAFKIPILLAESCSLSSSAKYMPGCKDFFVAIGRWEEDPAFLLDTISRNLTCCFDQVQHGQHSQREQGHIIQAR